MQYCTEWVIEGEGKEEEKKGTWRQKREILGVWPREVEREV